MYNFSIVYNYNQGDQDTSWLGNYPGDKFSVEIININTTELKPFGNITLAWYRMTYDRVEQNSNYSVERYTTLTKVDSNVGDMYLIETTSNQSQWDSYIEENSVDLSTLSITENITYGVNDTHLTRYYYREVNNGEAKGSFVKIRHAWDLKTGWLTYKYLINYYSTWNQILTEIQINILPIASGTNGFSALSLLIACIPVYLIVRKKNRKKIF